MRFSIAQADRPRVAELTLRAAVKAVQLQIDACNGQPVSLDTLAPPEALKTVTTSWDAVFEAWETHVKDRPKSTVIHQRTAWNGLLEFAKSRGVLFPGQVSTGLIADWVAQMQQRLGHKTVTERLGKVKRVYRVAVARELLTSDPAAKVLSPREPNHMKGLSHRKPFSKADLQVIFGCPIFTQHLRSAGQIGVTCPPKSVPRQRNRICATERTRDAQEQVHRRADHWFHQAG